MPAAIDMTAPPLDTIQAETRTERSGETGSFSHSSFGDASVYRQGQPPNPGSSVGDLADLSHVRSLQRELTKRTLLPQEKQIAEERQLLILKGVSGDALSGAEKRRLGVLEWQLNLIDDAVDGDRLDVIESLALHQDQLAREIEEVTAALRDRNPKVFGGHGKR